MCIRTGLLSSKKKTGNFFFRKDKKLFKMFPLYISLNAKNINLFWGFSISQNHHHNSAKTKALLCLGCGIFGFFPLSFPQKERKIYKVRQISLSLFVHFFRAEPSTYVYFYKRKYFVKVNIDGSALKKILSFWVKESRQKPNILHLGVCRS